MPAVNPKGNVSPGTLRRVQRLDKPLGGIRADVQRWWTLKPDIEDEDLNAVAESASEFGRARALKRAQRLERRAKSIEDLKRATHAREVGSSMAAIGRAAQQGKIGGAFEKAAGQEQAVREEWQRVKAERQKQEWAQAKGVKEKGKALLKRLGDTQAKYHHRSIFVWMAVIALAIFKDLLDVGTVELASWIDWIVDLGIGVTFWIVLGSRTLSFEQKLIKTILPTLMEMIPGLGIAPIWTFSVLYIYYRSEIMTKLPAKPEEKKPPG